MSFFDAWEDIQDQTRLVLNTIDGDLWASNQFWMVKVTDSEHPVARVLREFGVPLVPGVHSIGRSITPTVQEPVDMGAVVARQSKDLQPIALHQINDQTIYVCDTMGHPTRWYAIFTMPGGRIVPVNKDYLHFCERVSEGTWHGNNSVGNALVRLHEGKPTALLMPVRHAVSGAS